MWSKYLENNYWGVPLFSKLHISLHIYILDYTAAIFWNTSLSLLLFLSAFINYARFFFRTLRRRYLSVLFDKLIFIWYENLIIMVLWRNCWKFAYELLLQTHWMLYLKSAFVKKLLNASQFLDDVSKWAEIPNTI